MRLTGIYRDPRFSPQSVARDKAILDAVAQRLRSMGHEIDLFPEKALGHCELAPIVFSMAREMAHIELLQQHETAGHFVVNAPTALLHNDRLTISQKLKQHRISTPDFCLVSTDCPPLPFPFWMKRYDGCAESNEDIVKITDTKDWLDFLDRQQPNKQWMAMQHQQGAVFKFYGVSGTDFFNIAPVADKFEPHRYRSMALPTLCSLSLLRQEAQRAAEVLDCAIYGGDVIIDTQGIFHFIDFNDWPSFSVCRTAASTAIAQYLHRLTLQFT